MITKNPDPEYLQTYCGDCPYLIIKEKEVPHLLIFDGAECFWHRDADKKPIQLELTEEDDVKRCQACLDEQF